MEFVTGKGLRTISRVYTEAGRHADTPLGDPGDRTPALEVAYANCVRKLRTKKMTGLHAGKKSMYAIFVRKGFACV